MNEFKLLFVEDSAGDAALIERMLKKAGLSFHSHRVDSIPDLREVLDDSWDILISDFHLPGFNAEDVLKVSKEIMPDIPVVVLSGAMGEEAAVGMMRAGASDYLIKDKLEKLPYVVTRELKESSERKARRVAEKQVAMFQIQEKQWLETTLNSLPVPIFFAEAGSGKIQFVNKAFLKMSGDEVGDSYIPVGHKLLGTDGSEIAFENLPGARAERGQTVQGEELIWETNGTRYNVMVSAKLQPAMYHHKSMVVAAVNDISHLKKIQNDLRQAVEAKSQFLANMSHEIRTPLGAVLGFTDMLKDPNLTEEDRQKYSEVVDRNGQVLLQLIDDVLDLSKLESGRVQLENVKVSVLEMLKEVVYVFQPLAEKKNISIVVNEPDSTVPVQILTDPTRLKQIIMNLLGNAIKFTQEGSITLSIDCRKCPNTGRECLGILIRDTGIGIPIEKQQNLFQQFSQADASTTRKYGGTGLGLVLSRSIARALGGDLVLLESAPGVGSAFLATFGINENGIQTQAKLPFQLGKIGLAPRQDIRKLLGKKILLVEDSLDNQILFNLYLESEGAILTVCENGKVGVDRAVNEDFDLILMDIQLPVMDGIHATREIRRRGIATPIIALTAHALVEEKRRSIDAGCNGHVTKPVYKDKLISEICALLDL